MSPQSGTSWDTLNTPVGGPKITLGYFSNEFPRDDLSGIARSLVSRSKSRQHPILSRFINEATLAVRDEIRKLPNETRTLFPVLRTVFDLAEHAKLRTGPLGGSVDGVLLCAVELATFIGYHEASDNDSPRDTPSLSLVGLGIGLVAAAAVSISPSLSDLPLAGAEAVRVAFRLGVLVNNVSQNLQPPDASSTGSPDSWAYVIPDVTPADVQMELDELHTRGPSSSSSKIFISALSKTSVTISGPPSRLNSLLRLSDFFRDRNVVSLPVHGGLCHASHIYDETHVHEVVGQGVSQNLSKAYSPILKLISPSSGEPYLATTATNIFEQVVGEILTQKIQWDNVVGRTVDRAQELAAIEAVVLVFHTSLPVHELIKALDARGNDCRTTTEDMMQWISQSNDGRLSGPHGTLQSKIAIVGMSCRMPSGATDTEKFWELLEKGLDVHRKVPADRFDVDTHHDPTGKKMRCIQNLDTSITPYGCFIDEPGLFDAAFFNMSPREAQQTDPMQRLALVTAYEALERAGYVENRTAATNLHRIGTFYGQASDDYREVNTAQEISTYFIPGGCRAFGPGRINYFFKFSGPSYSIDTACSSSLATIQAACTSLWNGDTDTVVAGGMNVLTNSDAFAGLGNGHFLSKTPNACKTWDATADGYCRADGIGSIVMKRLEDAEADNDNILGIILAAGTNHSAEAVSITHPHAPSQAFLSRQILRDAGLDPLDVSYVEMHGTGTQAGDSEEMRSVSDVFAPVVQRRTTKNPLYVGAVKANVGHGEAVAGVTALIKVLLMFEKGAIPPHIGIKGTINPAFPGDLGKRNLNIPYNKTAWARNSERRRIAMVNNFSAAGGNTTIAIEEGPIRDVVGRDTRPAHTIAISAKSKTSLKGNIERFLAYLDAHPDVSLPDLSYTTTARRYHHSYRVAITTSDISHLKKQLSSQINSSNSHKPIPTTGPPSIAFAFTGQGASYPSMDLELYRDSPYFRAQIVQLDSMAQKQGFPSFIPAIDGSFPKEHIHRPIITQLALVCVEIALAKYWASLGVKPDIIVGHSLGEYAAFCTAGVLSASDAIFLVGQRALLLEKKCQVGSHKMLAVRASLAQVQDASRDLTFEIACVNGPNDTVLSATKEDVDVLTKAFEAAGYKCFVLDVAFAFHSTQMDAVLDDFERISELEADFQPLNLPVISPLLGKVVFGDKTINANYVRRATRESVNFLAGIEAAQKMSLIDTSTAWIEIGPHPVCMGFVKSSITATVAAPSIRRGADNWQTLAQTLGALHLAGVSIDWNEYHRPFEPSLRLLDLPTYSWNDKTYWLQYNGDWALTKGNTFYQDEKSSLSPKTSAFLPSSPISTSTVQRVTSETLDGPAGTVTIRSDLMQTDFHDAAYGHKMNNCGVVTSSIHADIVFTIGQYLYSKLKPRTGDVSDINITKLDVVKGLVAQRNRGSPQVIQVSISTADINSREAHVVWHNVHNDRVLDEHFATATVIYGNPAEWLRSWIPVTHLVLGRIRDLECLAEQGIANRFSRNMAYGLFARSLVDYADKYRGMQSVVLHELEAFADIKLSEDKSGKWTVPPFFIDSVAHLAGFVMNVSDTMQVDTHFCVTPGWESMRFARPLTAGSTYRSYVKMIPTAEDGSVFLGDVYVLQDNVIIGQVEAIKFRKYPRILLDRFFSAPDATQNSAAAHTPGKERPREVAAIQPPAVRPTAEKSAVTPAVMPLAGESTAKDQEPAGKAGAAHASLVTDDDDSITKKAIQLIASEAALEVSELQDDVSFANLGVDSLMSLVIAEKFRGTLGVTMSGSLFLEYPLVGDLRKWLLEYYG